MTALNGSVSDDLSLYCIHARGNESLKQVNKGGRCFVFFNFVKNWFQNFAQEKGGVFTFVAPRHDFARMDQGCQMIVLQIQNPNLGIFWRALEWKMWVNILAIWNSLQPLEISYGHLVHSIQFWCVVPIKIWQPWHGSARVEGCTEL
jgi:hypothetical protein